jgi:integrase
VGRAGPGGSSEEERERLLDYFRRKEWKIGGFDDRRLHYPYYAYLATLFFTGCRPSELAALRVGDVDLQQGAIRIRRSRHLGVEAAPKTRSANRWVRLARTRVAILEPLIELRAEPGDYLFKNVHGDPIDQSNFAGLFRDAARSVSACGSSTRRNTPTCLWRSRKA